MSTKSIYVATTGWVNPNTPNLSQQLNEAMEELDREGYSIVGLATVCRSDGMTVGIIVAGQGTEK